MVVELGMGCNRRGERSALEPSVEIEGGRTREPERVGTLFSDVASYHKRAPSLKQSAHGSNGASDPPWPGSAGQSCLTSRVRMLLAHSIPFSILPRPCSPPAASADASRDPSPESRSTSGTPPVKLGAL